MCVASHHWICDHQLHQHQETNTWSNGLVGKILAWGEADKRAGRVIGSVLLSVAHALWRGLSPYVWRIWTGSWWSCFQETAPWASVHQGTTWQSWCWKVGKGLSPHLRFLSLLPLAHEGRSSLDTSKVEACALVCLFPWWKPSAKGARRSPWRSSQWVGATEEWKKKEEGTCAQNLVNLRPSHGAVPHNR